MSDYPDNWAGFPESANMLRDCQGTACDKAATHALLIRAEVRKAFGDPQADDAVVERLYCDDCTGRAQEREFSEVINLRPLAAPSSRTDP